MSKRSILILREDDDDFDYSFILTQEELTGLDRAGSGDRVELPSINGHADFNEKMIGILYSRLPEQYGTVFARWPHFTQAIRSAIQSIDNEDECT